MLEIEIMHQIRCAVQLFNGTTVDVDKKVRSDISYLYVSHAYSVKQRLISFPVAQSSRILSNIWSSATVKWFFQSPTSPETDRWSCQKPTLAVEIRSRCDVCTMYAVCNCLKSYLCCDTHTHDYSWRKYSVWLI